MGLETCLAIWTPQRTHKESHGDPTELFARTLQRTPAASRQRTPQRTHKEFHGDPAKLLARTLQRNPAANRQRTLQRTHKECHGDPVMALRVGICDVGV